MELKSLLKPRICPVCGATFIPEHPRSKFCSMKCRHDAEVSRHKGCRKRAKAKPKRGLERLSGVCVCCGRQFASYSQDQAFCSRRCKGVFQQLTRAMKAERRAQARAREEMFARLAARDAEYARLFPEQAKRHYAEISVSNGSVIDAEINRRYG